MEEAGTYRRRGTDRITSLEGPRETPPSHSSCSDLQGWSLNLSGLTQGSSPSEVPVSCNLNVKGHFDIEQVLVLPEVARHLVLGVPQVTLQLPNAVL